MFNIYDFDKSQLITTDELTILLKTALTALNSMIKKGPPTLLEIQKKSEEILEKYDFNKDGCISLKEFQSFVTKDPDILQCLYHVGLI